MAEKVRLYYPCERSPEDMPLMGKDRYCDGCEKLIPDFRHYSDEQLIAYMQSTAGQQRCGIFRPDQLDQRYAFIKTLELKAKTFAAAVLALFGVKSAIAGSAPPAAAAPLVTSLEDDSVCIILKGRLLDERSGAPLSNAAIRIAYADREAGVVTTDAEGNFEMRLEGPKGFEVQLSFKDKNKKYHPLTINNYAPGGSEVLILEAQKIGSQKYRRKRRPLRRMFGHRRVVGKF